MTEELGSKIVSDMMAIIRELAEAAARRTGLSRRRGREISKELKRFKEFKEGLEHAEAALAEVQEPSFDEADIGGPTQPEGEGDETNF